MRRAVGVAVLGVVSTLLASTAVAAWAHVLKDPQPPYRADPPPTPVVSRYQPPTVEVADGLNIDQAEVSAFVERVVQDPRGWRTDLDQFTFRIVAPGYRGTCGFGQDVGRAFIGEDLGVMTADAWVRNGISFGATGGTLDDQRTQVFMHEMGHLLGRPHHTECPGSGPAPVMRANTYKLGNCTLNVWPNPAN